MHIHEHETPVEKILRDKGFRATKSRTRLLELLQKNDKPLSIQDILSVWKENAPDQATLYRSLTDLSRANVVRRIDLNTGIAHFEYTPLRPHHHHIVCTDCGAIEETELCFVAPLEKKVVRESSLFNTITTHSLEFFGVCKLCITSI